MGVGVGVGVGGAGGGVALAIAYAGWLSGTVCGGESSSTSSGKNDRIRSGLGLGRTRLVVDFNWTGGCILFAPLGQSPKPRFGFLGDEVPQASSIGM